jgi:ribosome recycling factor
MLEGVYKDSEKRMVTALDALKRELGSIRTGKASVHLLDHIAVEAYGTRMPLNQLATLGAPEARMLTVQPFDRSQMQAIEKAIRASDLGVNPTNDGAIIRIPIPPLNEERRKDFVKLARKHGEEAKVAIRNVRRDTNERLKKAKEKGEIPEDDVHRGTEKVQKMTDDFVAQVDKIMGAKEKEIMEV